MPAPVSAITPAKRRWPPATADLAEQSVVFEVDLTRLSSPRGVDDLFAEFARGRSGREGRDVDFHITDLSNSPLDALTEVPAPTRP